MPKRKTPKRPTKVTRFDKPTLRAILDDAKEALGPVAEKYGLKLERKSCTYSEDECPVAFKFLITETDSNGNLMSSDAKAFVREASLYGLKGTDLGKEFRFRGDTYRISGLKPKSRKYPILGENVQTGKTFKFAAEDVAASLKRAA